MPNLYNEIMSIKPDSPLYPIRMAIKAGEAAIDEAREQATYKAEQKKRVGREKAIDQTLSSRNRIDDKDLWVKIQFRQWLTTRDYSRDFFEDLDDLLTDPNNQFETRDSQPLIIDYLISKIDTEMDQTNDPHQKVKFWLRLLPEAHRAVRDAVLDHLVHNHADSLVALIENPGEGDIRQTHQGLMQLLAERCEALPDDLSYKILSDALQPFFQRRGKPLTQAEATFFARATRQLSNGGEGGGGAPADRNESPDTITAVAKPEKMGAKRKVRVRPGPHVQLAHKLAAAGKAAAARGRLRKTRKMGRPKGSKPQTTHRQRQIKAGVNKNSHKR